MSNNKHGSLSVVALLGLLLTELAVAAPLGTAITYQGRLKQGGSPHPGPSAQLTFRLYDQAAGGTLIGTVGPQVVAVSEGLFTVSLDFGGAAFNGQARWLEIQVEATTLSPRQELTPAPFALHTRGVHYNDATGGVGIGTASPTPGAPLTIFSQAPNNTAGMIHMNVADPFAGSHRMLMCRKRNQANNANHDWLIEQIGDPPVIYFTRAERPDGGPATFATPLALDWDGDVGIGTTSPGERLTVAGTVHSTSGGFRFPDGTLQTTAAAGGSSGWSLTGNAGTDPATNFLGTTDNQPLELRTNNLRALRIEPTTDAANVIAGHSHNATSNGVIGGTISGGGVPFDGSSFYGNNRVTDSYGTIGGGYANLAGDNTGTTSDQLGCTVGGGVLNEASGIVATVSGGESNTALGIGSAISGGHSNTASGIGSSVGGGLGNAAVEDSATIGGGWSNSALGPRSTVGGGASNEAGLMHSTVGGGTHNSAAGEASTIAGGSGNEAEGTYSTIAGGWDCTATGDSSTLGGGRLNTAGGFSSTVAGGWDCTASGALSTLGGGRLNTAGGFSSTIAGGNSNTASGDYSSVGGGQDNAASGHGSSIAGGLSNIASGSASFAAGYRANAIHDGAFVWADSIFGDVQSTAPNQFLVRASGGVLLATGNGNIPQIQAVVPPSNNPTSLGLNANGGNVGIGTTIPQNKLDVEGSAAIGVSYSGTNAAPANGLIVQGNVGIGTTSPTATLDVAGSLEVDATTLVVDSASNFVGMGTSTPNGPLHIYSSVTPDTSAFNDPGLLLGSAGDVTYKWIQSYAGPLAINQLGQNVGIGTTAPSQKLHVVGNICATGTIATCSDARFKTGVEPLDGALEKIEQLRPVAFDWKRADFPDHQFGCDRQIGLIAQEVRDILPEVVSEGSDGYLSIDYGRLTPMIVEALRELRGEKDRQLAEKEREIDELKARLDRLEQLVTTHTTANQGGF